MLSTAGAEFGAWYPLQFVIERLSMAGLIMVSKSMRILLLLSLLLLGVACFCDCCLAWGCTVGVAV